MLYMFQGCHQAMTKSVELLSNGENFDPQKVFKNLVPEKVFKKVKSAELPQICGRVVSLIFY